jgi:hypothetical protein
MPKQPTVKHDNTILMEIAHLPTPQVQVVAKCAPRKDIPYKIGLCRLTILQTDSITDYIAQSRA